MSGEIGGAMPEAKPVCPRCASGLLAAIGNGWHCISCGWDGNVDRNVIATAAEARKARRSATTGYNQHVHANDGLQELEAEVNLAESDLRIASREVLRCPKQDAERLRDLRRIEQIAKEHLDSLLKAHAERVAAAEK
jgi:ribosomal protein S27AE